MLWRVFDHSCCLDVSGSLAPILRRNESNFSKLHVRGRPLNDLVRPLDLIEHVRRTVNAELRLVAIRADPRRVRVVPVFPHSDGFGADLGGRFPVHAVGRLVRGGARLQ